jgi:ribosome maturation factor RimP
MINKEYIEGILESFVEERGFFVVNLNISTSNKISVLIDSMEGITIDECVEISRAIEGSLDREKEDFELQVSSPGLSEPLRVIQQYEKNVGRELEILLDSEDKKLKGKLLGVEGDNIKVEAQQKVKLVGKKKKQLIIETKDININNIKTAKILISFK